MAASGSERSSSDRSSSGSGSGRMWDGDEAGRAAYWRLEDRAERDAMEAMQRIWRDGLPDTGEDASGDGGGGESSDGDLRPIAVAHTYEFIAQMRQESTAIPRWAWDSLEAQREYIQMSGDRYYWAFLRALGRLLGASIAAQYRIPPRMTPLLRFPSSGAGGTGKPTQSQSPQQKRRS